MELIGKLAVFLDQPGPATAKAAGCSRIELVFELVQGAKGLINGSLEVSRGAIVPGGVAHDLPEEAVVVVATSIVAAWGPILQRGLMRPQAFQDVPTLS